MKKNNLMLIVYLIIVCIQLKAQGIDYKTIAFKKKQFFVEATVLEAYSYESVGTVYSSHIINISKIYYDVNENPPVLNCGTLQDITIGGEYDGIKEANSAHGSIGLLEVGSKWFLNLNKNTYPFNPEITNNSLACY